MNTEEPFRQDPSEELAQRIAYLINGYIRKSLTVSEHEELDEWVTASMENQQLFEELSDPANIKKWINWKERIDSDAALEKIKIKLGFEREPQAVKRRRIWSYWIAAAAVISLVFLGDYWYQKRAPSGLSAGTVLHDLPPGGKHAMLTLNDGTKIWLDTISSGKIAERTNIQILKDSAQLSYTREGIKNPPVTFDELSTPAGGEYQVRLSDGTRVWLNASSSLRYPQQFADSVRKVELTGEGYFEVAKDASHPFIVMAGENEIRVLGTHFDVNHYKDNPDIIVTLAEGSVKLNRSVLLKPGEEGLINAVGNIQIEKADLEVNLAWKDGQFVFKMTPLDEVMREVSHWYDARVVYQDNNTEHFNARIPRDVPVSKLLHLLEATGRVHFKIEDKTITVLN
jgi:transmembrane sensor